MKRKLITVTDIFVILAVVAVSIFLFLSATLSSVGKTAVITVNNAEVAVLSLQNNATKLIETEQGYNEVVIFNGECFVRTADCRDEICINRGKISKVGESIVCLPHKLIVEIK